jgi:hypothetical protein
MVDKVYTDKAIYNPKQLHTKLVSAPFWTVSASFSPVGVSTHQLYRHKKKVYHYGKPFPG